MLKSMQSVLSVSSGMMPLVYKEWRDSMMINTLSLYSISFSPHFCLAIQIIHNERPGTDLCRFAQGSMIPREGTH